MKIGRIHFSVTRSTRLSSIVMFVYVVGVAVGLYVPWSTGLVVYCLDHYLFRRSVCMVSVYSLTRLLDLHSMMRCGVILFFYSIV